MRSPPFPIFTIYFIISWELCKFQKNKKSPGRNSHPDHLPCRTLPCEQVFLYLNVNSLHMFLLSPVYAPLQARAPRLVCTKLRDRRRRGCPRVTEQSRPVCPLRKYPFCHRQNAARTTRSPWTPSIRQSLFNGHQLSFFAT